MADLGYHLNSISITITTMRGSNRYRESVGLEPVKGSILTGPVSRGEMKEGMTQRRARGHRGAYLFRIWTCYRPGQIPLEDRLEDR